MTAVRAIASRMLKSRFLELRERAGTLAEVSAYCRVGSSTLARYGSLSEADAACYPPVDVIRDLELLVGEPIVTTLLCELMGGAFVAVPNVPASSADLLCLMAGMTSEFNDATGALCRGLSDGKFCPRDAGELERELDDLIRVVISMRSLARSLKGGDR